MTVSGSDITVVLSGGSTNSNPNDSLGGDPSSIPVNDGSLNNLFDDIESEQSTVGHEDYRCIYYFNDGNDTIYDVNLLMHGETSEGTSVTLGVTINDEVQKITLSSGATGGTLELSYAGFNFTTNYNVDINVWAFEIQEGLRSILDVNGNNLLKDVVVSAQYFQQNTIFTINFIGEDGKKDHPQIVIEDNSLTPLVAAVVTTTSSGAPIDSISSNIGTETTPPGGVTFYDPLSVIELSHLNPSSGFPIWVKRTIEMGSSSASQDGATIRFSARSLE